MILSRGHTPRVESLLLCLTSLFRSARSSLSQRSAGLLPSSLRRHRRSSPWSPLCLRTASGIHHGGVIFCCPDFFPCMLFAASLSFSVRESRSFGSFFHFLFHLVSSLPWPDPATQPLASQLQDCPPASVSQATTSVQLSSCSPCAVSETSTYREHLCCSFHSLLSDAESEPRSQGSCFRYWCCWILVSFRVSSFAPSGTGRPILRSFLSLIGILTPQSTSRTNPTFPNSCRAGIAFSSSLFCISDVFRESALEAGRWMCRGLVSSSSGTHGFHCG